MTRQELEHVRFVLMKIAPNQDGDRHGKVLLALNYVEKDLTLRRNQRDNFKDLYELQHDNNFL